MMRRDSNDELEQLLEADPVKNHERIMQMLRPLSLLSFLRTTPASSRRSLTTAMNHRCSTMSRST